MTFWGGGLAAAGTGSLLYFGMQAKILAHCFSSAIFKSTFLSVRVERAGCVWRDCRVGWIVSEEGALSDSDLIAEEGK